MRKFYLVLLAMIASIASVWAETVTTDWIDYSNSFGSSTMTDGSGNWYKSYTITDLGTLGNERYVEVILQSTTGRDINRKSADDYFWPWLRAGKAFTIGVSSGYKIAAYELTTRGSGGTYGAFVYTTAEGTATSVTQSGSDSKITVENLNADVITLDLSSYPVNGVHGLLITGLRLKLVLDMDVLAEVVINVQNEGETTPKYTKTMRLPVGKAINPISFLPANGIYNYTGTYSGTTVTLGEGRNVYVLRYTQSVPYAANYEELNSGDKWVSLFTKNGRMHVYDDSSFGKELNAAGNVIDPHRKKYPTIDKATFTRLTDDFFWGFVCADPFTSPTVKIMNKGRGDSQSLYLTTNVNNDPLLFGDIDGLGVSGWITDEWVIVKGKLVDGVQYYGVRANGTNRYINNYANAGFMTTHSDGPLNDDGSNHKFTPEKETYEIMMERALKAPYNAVHSLNVEARAAIKANNNKTVVGYKAVIADINDDDNETGVVQFDKNKYYYLRNYTPEGASVYVLGSDNGTAARTFTVPSAEAGSADNAMTYSNINAIWKITSGTGDQPSEGGYTGASRATPRMLTLVNTAKQLTNVSTRNLAETGANYYFIDLGAGQHFLKNVAYAGTGAQSKAHSLSCSSSGTLQESGNAHYKNTRDAWYGIEVSSIDVTITDAKYATIYLPFGVTIPEGSGLKAYAVTAVAGGVATLTPVTSIPATQGVILYAEKEGTYKLNIDDAATWGITDNKLSGSCMAENISDDAYVLSKPDGKDVGLYKADRSSGTWKNNDNKAYLLANKVIDIEGNSRFLSFDFGTETGLDVIKGTESASSESVVYDLSGRRVRNAQKGLYIMNGKKVIK